uniref:Uncharacterized protein n=1 Tax=Oryza meridionalis TaxID=40149 RepID=A0A0E0C305_9ORYZ
MEPSQKGQARGAIYITGRAGCNLNGDAKRSAWCIASLFIQGRKIRGQEDPLSQILRLLEPHKNSNSTVML